MAKMMQIDAAQLFTQLEQVGAPAGFPGPGSVDSRGARAPGDKAAWNDALGSAGGKSSVDTKVSSAETQRLGEGKTSSNQTVAGSVRQDGTTGETARGQASPQGETATQSATARGNVLGGTAGQAGAEPPQVATALLNANSEQAKLTALLAQHRLAQAQGPGGTFFGGQAAKTAAAQTNGGSTLPGAFAAGEGPNAATVSNEPVQGFVANAKLAQEMENPLRQSAARVAAALKAQAVAGSQPASASSTSKWAGVAVVEAVAVTTASESAKMAAQAALAAYRFAPNEAKFEVRESADPKSDRPGLKAPRASLATAAGKTQPAIQVDSNPAEPKGLAAQVEAAAGRVGGVGEMSGRAEGATSHQTELGVSRLAAAKVAPASPVDMTARVEVVRQLSELTGRHLLRQVGEGGGTIRLRLDPPELGKMRLEVHVDRDIVRAEAVVENGQARQLLNQSVDQLRELLSQKGLDLQQFDVSEQASRQAGDQDGRQQADPHGRTASRSTLSGFGETNGVSRTGNYRLRGMAGNISLRA
jgi:flagellar hook-length control protein FliK